MIKLKTIPDNLELFLFYSLALINRTGGLYGRIFTQVVSTDRKQWDLYTQLSKSCQMAVDPRGDNIVLI